MENHSGIKVHQYGLFKIILMFLWPAVWFSILIYGLALLFISENAGYTPTWLVIVISLLGNGAEISVAIGILRREGEKITWNYLKERLGIRWPKAALKEWLTVLGIVTAAFVFTMLLMPLETEVARNLPPPQWMPDHPLKEIESIRDAFPDVNLLGNFGFIFLNFFVVNLIFTTFGEELYYRAVLLPKMRGVFGKYDFIANGIGFTLKHAYFYWRFPMILPCSFAFPVVYKVLGLPMAMLLHWLTNMEPFSLYEAIKAAVGI